MRSFQGGKSGLGDHPFSSELDAQLAAAMRETASLAPERKERNVMPTRWEYAMFQWFGPGMGKTRRIWFTHREHVDKLPGGMETYHSTFRRLGDEGFEMCWGFASESSSENTYWFKRPLED